MNRVVLNQLEGITVNDTEITFGKRREEVIALLGEPQREEEAQLYYDSLDIRFDFDDHGFLEFIECQGPHSENSEFRIFNVDPFNMNDEQLVDLLTKANNGEIDDFEAPYSFCFLEISVGVWRAATPADLESAIEQAKADGSYSESGESMHQQLESARYFSTVAVGKRGYYK